MGVFEALSQIKSVGMGVVLILLGLMMLYSNVMLGGLVAMAVGIYSIMQRGQTSKKALSRAKGDALNMLFK